MNSNTTFMLVEAIGLGALLNSTWMKWDTFSTTMKVAFLGGSILLLVDIARRSKSEPYTQCPKCMPPEINPGL